jgi:hypothetical protein
MSVSLAKHRADRVAADYNPTGPCGVGGPAPALREVTHVVRGVLVVVDTLRAADVQPCEHLAALDDVTFDPPALVEHVSPVDANRTVTIVVWGRTSLISLDVDAGAPARVVA